jgi:hypothetical protein|tara:strand:- start:569 stop:790 length:222 start_codon:yes stop_codon:yes gene_type:complete
MNKKRKTRKLNNADTAHLRIDNHEKLCRIMQKETHDKIDTLANQIARLEKILIGAAGLIISGLGAALVQLISK